MHLKRDDDFHITPIAESAITIRYGPDMDIAANKTLLALQSSFRNNPFIGFIDTSITFNSLTVFFQPRQLIAEGQLKPLAFAIQAITDIVQQFKSASPQQPDLHSTHHLIPVCYDERLAPDLAAVATYHKTSPEAIITAHTSQDWYVFMVGFQPGFTYMGVLPPSLAMPRKPTPAVRVEPGAVGIAGKQTGIYPHASPGGWQLIGRTPLKVFNPAEASPCLLKAGDTVRFSPIDFSTFQYLNQHANT